MNKQVSQRRVNRAAGASAISGINHGGYPGEDRITRFGVGVFE